ncbi:hypothetical protein LPB136_11560 [Tenacibaculum todarodis]|uniref:Uncharacterized protein n=1 Tax=Tenacibaculum todarodis TaxID=1850252 RepID=A0A1L3JLD4_9FLAO|nr:hypothetical protein [Tenacibaculum todarodis]APG65960.1 hypothetical protein LPB136_11560 [Tenacibaculum todarodis]
MELTKDQVLQIDNYISACGIKYYDVKMEIVDHFASILEYRLEKEPNLYFKNAIVEEHKKFSDNGFKKLLETKTKSTHKRFIKQTFLNFKTFFKLPKVIISIALFFVLLQIMDVVENKEYFFLGLNFFALILTFSLAFIGMKRSKKERTFLTLNMTMRFVTFFHSFVIILQLFNNRGEISLLNKNHNYLHIGAYVLLFLLFWSGEYVYYQNKKEVQQQYPNVIV